jgi:hypothetical protein
LLPEAAGWLSRDPRLDPVGLIEKIGIAKTCAERKEVVRKHRGIFGEEELALLHASGAEISAATDQGDGSFHVEIAERTSETRFVDYPVPSEEFLFASRTRHEDDADYLCHRSAKSISDLIEMGFDRELVEDLPADAMTISLDSRSTARWLDETQVTVSGSRRVWLREEYKRVDLDGDGVAELVKVFPGRRCRAGRRGSRRGAVRGVVPVPARAPAGRA